MNKKVLILGAVAMVAMAGCQNVTDQLGNKLAESVINSATNGEVKVNINDLQNGKINVTTKEGTISMSGDENGGSLKMTDTSGKVVVDANGKDGSLVVNDSEGNTSTFSAKDSGGRPSDAPADMPTLDGGTDFSTVKLGADSLTMIYKVAEKDLKTVCDKQTSALMGAGWKSDEDSFNFEGSDGIMRNYINGEYMMILSCGPGDGEGTTVTLQKNKKAA